MNTKQSSEVMNLTPEQRQYYDDKMNKCHDMTLAEIALMEYRDRQRRWDRFMHYCHTGVML